MIHIYRGTVVVITPLKKVIRYNEANGQKQQKTWFGSLQKQQKNQPDKS